LCSCSGFGGGAGGRLNSLSTSLAARWSVSWPPALRQEIRPNHLADRKTWETLQRRQPGYAPTGGQRGGQAVEPAAGAAAAYGAGTQDCRANRRGLEGIERSIAPALSVRRLRSALFLDRRHRTCVAVTRTRTNFPATPKPNRKWLRVRDKNGALHLHINSLIHGRPAAGRRTWPWQGRSHGVELTKSRPRDSLLTKGATCAGCSGMAHGLPIALHNCRPGPLHGGREVVTAGRALPLRGSGWGLTEWAWGQVRDQA
jgi:hypothetical protein